MSNFIMRRFLGLFSVLFIVSIITFLLMHAVPGGPFSREKPLPEATVALLNAKYNLDAPVIEQYLDYMGDILIPRVTYGRIPPSATEDYLINMPLPAFMGDQAALRWINFGPTYGSRSRSVNDIFLDTFPVSFQLGIAAMAVALAIGVPLGTLSALKRNTVYDYAGMGVAVFGVSLPVIISAPIMQYLFGVQLKILPPTGWGDIQHYILPAFALGFVNSALIARLTRASLLQVLNEDYIRTARAKGLSERMVVIGHAVKNSMIPVVTVLGPLFAVLVTGSFVVETFFGVPGLGRFFVTSVRSRDYPVIMGTILLFAALVSIANTAVDIIYGWIDPRIRYD